MIQLTDPSPGVCSAAIVIPSARTLAWLAPPDPGCTSFQGGFPINLWKMGQLSVYKWQKKIETLGTREIQGFECEGVRRNYTSQDQPAQTASQENWDSTNQRVLMEVIEQGAGWKRTIKLEDVTRDEPDPALFVVPPDYQVLH